MYLDISQYRNRLTGIWDWRINQSQAGQLSKNSLKFRKQYNEQIFIWFAYCKKQCHNNLHVAAVSCIPVPYRFRWDGIWVWDDGLAGQCMGVVHGCMAWAVHWVSCIGAWHGCMGWCMVWLAGFEGLHLIELKDRSFSSNMVHAHTKRPKIFCVRIKYRVI